MKLIIDIDERVYKDCLKLKNDNDMGVLGFHLINATANGIPFKNPLIVKCNRMLPDEAIEEVRQAIKKQMEEYTPVVILPSGFELAEVNVELLEQIKTEIEKLEYQDFDCNDVLPSYETIGIIQYYITELKMKGA